MVSSDNVIAKVYEGFEGFLALEEQWLCAAENFGSHFLHFPVWYRAELEKKEIHRVYFVALYDAQRLLAILPFEQSNIKKGALKIPVIQLFYPNEMGVNDVLSCVDLKEFMPLITQSLRKAIGFFVLMRWQCVLFNGHAATVGQVIRETHASKFIEFKDGAEDFWANYSKKFLKGLAKKEKKAQESGDLTLKVVRSLPELDDAFNAFLQMENSGWKGESGTSIAKQPDKKKYYQRLLADYGLAGHCQINLLLLSGEPIAAQFGVRVNNILYLLKIGYDEACSAVSPGYLLLAKLVDHESAAGEVNRVSFVTGVNWIDRWKPQVNSVGIFYSHNGTWWGKSLLKLGSSRLAKKLLKKQ